MFMAPEAIHGKTRVDGRTDMYALAVVAYYLVTGTALFEGKTVIEVCLKHMSAKPEPFAARNPHHDAPPELEALLLSCLAKEPDDRPESVATLSRKLAEIDLPEWTHDRARAWWRERGVVVTSRIRDKRGPQEDASTAQTLAVADFRPDVDRAG
jgi:serine/threonine-protein kinase